MGIEQRNRVAVNTLQKGEVGGGFLAPGKDSPMAKRKDNRIDYVELHGKNMAKMEAFYAKVCGWSFQKWGDDYSSFNDGRLDGGITTDAKERSKAPLVVLFSSDLEAARDRVRKAGGKIVRDIFAFPGGRRFHFADPAGNELAVWSEK